MNLTTIKNWINNTTNDDYGRADVQDEQIAIHGICKMYKSMDDFQRTAIYMRTHNYQKLYVKKANYWSGLDSFNANCKEDRYTQRAKFCEIVLIGLKALGVNEEYLVSKGIKIANEKNMPLERLYSWVSYMKGM